MRVEDIANDPGFCHLSELQGVAVDLRYAGPHNFAGRSLYGSLDCAWLRREAAQALAKAAAWLALQKPGWRILVLDALRPQRTQQAAWDIVAGTPGEAYFAHPQRGSIHSWGMAVDVTLLDATGLEVDMGSAFDEMDDISHPEFHSALLASGRLLPQQVAHRDVLRQAMLQAGFQGIDTEWWHFDLGDRTQVRRQWPRVE
jgi:D-alanyl-D-alanine dipeptidase